MASMRAGFGRGKSAFSGIGEAQQMGGNRRLELGNYLLQVDAVRFFESRKTGAPVFAVDFEVVESNNPTFQKGDKAGYVTVQSKFPVYFLADIKAFLAAAEGCSPDDITEEAADRAVAEDQPLRGNKVRCHVTPGKTEEFPVYRFLAAK